MKKRNILYTLLAFLLVVSVASCRKDPKIGGTAVQSLAGEWWVQVDDGSGFGSKYYGLSTYNTAANTPDSMWIDDAGSFWDFKGKINTNIANHTFSGSNVANQSYPSNFTITEGVVIPNKATAPGSGDKVDSIRFKVTFDDDPTPGTVYTVSGYKRTGFPEDDH